MKMLEDFCRISMLFIICIILQLRCGILAECYDTHYMVESFNALQYADKQIPGVPREALCRTHCSADSTCAAYSYNLTSSICYISERASVIQNGQREKTVFVKRKFFHKLDLYVIDIDECTLNEHNCDSNAYCTNTHGSFTCNCNDGFVGDGTSCSDINECDTGADNCDTHATCQNTDGSFACTCIDGYTGDGTLCSDIDECNSGADNCDSHATCTNTLGSFNCTCNGGYIGDGTSCSECMQPGAVFIGSVNQDATGRSCVRWDGTNDYASKPQLFPDASVSDAQDYCRDPTNSGTPWCCNNKNCNQRGDCDIPECCTQPRSVATVVLLWSVSTTDTCEVNIVRVHLSQKCGASDSKLPYIHKLSVIGTEPPDTQHSPDQYYRLNEISL